tara:strand:- start:38037 stop:38660 length:624 start_codon:yes stop_codon:yes gene_type:complete
MEPEKRRGQILATARLLMVKSGSEGVRVEDILTELSLSKGGFYHHFKSMNEVIAALVAEDLRALIEGKKRRSDESKSATEGLLSFFEYGSDDRQGNSGILESMSSRSHRLAYLEILEEELYKPFREVLRGVLQRGMTNGEFAPGNGAALVPIFEAVNRQLNRQAILRENVGEIPEIRDLALNMLFRELGISQKRAVQEFMATWKSER